MWCVSYFLCFFILYQVVENSAQVSHPYIVSIKLKLQEERIPRLIAESLFGNNTNLTQYFDYSHVSMDDVTEVIGTRSVTLNEAFKALGIELNDICNAISQTTLTRIVEAGNINIHHLYNTFVQYFVSNPMQDIPKLLSSLKIDNQKFSTAVVFGTNQQLLDIVLEGSYTKTNIEKALEVVKHDVTLKEALSFVKSARLGEALTTIKNSSLDIHVFDMLGGLLVVDKVLKLFNLLNISATNFYHNQAFNKILKNIVDTKEELIGSAISATTIITNSGSNTLIDYQFLKNYTQLIAILIEDSDMQYVIVNTSAPASSSVATLPVLQKLQLHEYVHIAPSIDSRKLNSCTYVSLNVLCNTLHNENVVVRLDENDFLIINKTNSTIFNLGSPLICGEYLYGVADWEHESFISFIPFRLEVESYNRNAEGYLAVVMDYVKQARTLVLSSICSVLEYLSIGICSKMFTS